MFDYLKGRVPKLMDEALYKNFAVMVPLVRMENELFVVFEKRAAHLKRQPGEICFPGGARDGEETPLENAVRETMEELQLSREQIDVIAQMDTLLTVYDNRVFVFLCELKAYKMTYAREEVGEVFVVPLAYFLEQKPDVYINSIEAHTPENFPYDKIPGGRNYDWRPGHKNIYFYEYEDKVIWGMTAYIMQHVAKTICEERGTE
jgi:8-oxo-dGTP pyrophosphatase MutT (NUDIX family)